MKKNSANTTNPYKTNKLSLAAYLIASGASELVSAYCAANQATVVFALSPIPSAEQIASFFNGAGQVRALAYNNALTNLKAVVFEAKRASTPVSGRGNTQ